MAGFNGSGTYVRNYNWVNDKNNGIDITASRFDTEDNGYATGLSTCICKDGQTTTSAIIPFAQGITAAAGSTSQMMIGKIGEATTGMYSGGTGSVDFASGGTRVGGLTSTGINSTNIGVTTPGTGNFTTLTATSIVGPISANAVGKVAVTQPATGSTITVADGKTLTASHTITLAGGDAATLAIAASKTLTVSNSLTLAGTDATTMTFPGTTDTVVTLTATQTLTNKTLTSPTITTGALGSSTATTQSALDNSTKVATTAYTDAAVSSGGGLVLLSTVNASGVTTVSFGSTFLTSTYRKYIIEIDGMFTNTGTNGLVAQLSSNNGSTILTANNYYWNGAKSVTGTLTAFAQVNGGGGGSNGWQINNGANTGTSLRFSSSGRMTIVNPSATTSPQCEWKWLNTILGGTASDYYDAVGFYDGGSAITYNYIQFNAGGTATITGTFKIYGLR